MENYAEFAQLCLSRLKKNEAEEEEHSRPLSASSLIRFYGRPILPPLLSGKQREEMRRHRDEAQEAKANRKLKDDSKMAYVQTILHSVQLRKTPTLQDLLQEMETKFECPHLSNNGRFSVSCSDVSIGTRESLSPGPAGKLKNGIAQPPKISTTYSAYFPSSTPPQQSFQEEYLTERLDCQQGSQPCSFNAASHQSLSSGYVTCENQENATADSVHTTEETSNNGGFFLHSTSNTIAKMPDIISHPPIDGEELERTGLESFFCTNIMAPKDLCSTSFHIDSLRNDPLRAEQPASSRPHSRNKEVDIPSTAQLNPARNSSTETNDGSLPLSEKNSLSDHADLQRSLNLTEVVHVQKPPSKAEAEPADIEIDVADLKQPEESRPLSLQALLKKSQEYRRRQRMLRNQAKNTKMHQERTQEKLKERAEEPSLSDKENDELHHKGAVTIEGKKTKEGRGTLICSEEPSPQKPWKTHRFECKGVAEDGKAMERLSIEEETFLKNKLNSSQEVIATPKQVSVLIQQQQSLMKTSLIQGTFNEPPGLPSFHGGVEKYRSVPVPSFCLSPVPCKNKTVDAAGTPEPKSDSSSDFNEVRVKDINLDHQRSPMAVPSGNVIAGDDVTRVFAKGSLHIDELESNLCSLKVLISDLESTVKENLDDRREPDCSVQSNENLESSKDYEQIENAGPDNSSCCLEDTQDAAAADDDDGNEVDDLWQRQSFIQFMNMDKDVGPNPRSSLRDVSLQNGSEIIKLSQHSQVRASVKENRNETSPERGGSGNTLRGVSKTEQLPSKNTMSVAQQMRIPSIFRNVTCKNVPVAHLSHLKERVGNIVAGAEGPAPSQSLNQSYDVDTPSDLWLQEGSGSDLGSQRSYSQTKGLTPESGGEDQSGVSKVKRRLLMHVTEGTVEMNERRGRAVDCVVGPNSGAATAGVYLSEGCGFQKQETLKSKQERLKQIHAAQVRALQEEHRKQQEELLQVLATRYRLLQDVSPCSRLGDTLTFSSLPQPLSPLSQRCRPLVAAAVKGFLTRRLLRTERVAQLVRTIRDTQQFLQAFQQQSASRGDRCSRQDVLLQERVALQLRAARYEVYDIFFSLPAGEQMQLIRWDRELARERQLRRQNGHAGCTRGKSSLSAATQKSLERKRERMIQKKAAECHRGAAARTGPKSGFSVEKRQETKNRGHFKANPQRVPKSVCSSRPR
ncbi:PREDICTED: uncharacterized protein LOC106917550 isoform X1 [Poecilia mexicana]|uniref:Uncharacterized protein n=1 Tax=Poecilia mexicana TaxID=48701 RepID=A0A3B3YPH3_9TELE|nr:PREDICTED: uncharacterized protein LOC106917550 isoform X1 [Poecilia mexicana]